MIHHFFLLLLVCTPLGSFALRQHNIFGKYLYHANGDYTFTLHGRDVHSEPMFLQFRNDFTGTVRQYKIAQHQDFIHINKTSQSEQQITVNSDALFKHLRTDISSVHTAINGQISIMFDRNGTIKQSPFVFVRHLLRQRINNHHKNDSSKSEQESLPQLMVQFLQQGRMNSIHKYGFEFMVNDDVRPMRLNKINLVFVSNIISKNETNCDLTSITYEIWPNLYDKFEKLDYDLFNNRMTTTAAFDLASLMAHLVQIVPPDIMLFEGSIHLAITTANKDGIHLSFTSESIQIKEWIDRYSKRAQDTVYNMRKKYLKRWRRSRESFFDICLNSLVSAFNAY